MKKFHKVTLMMAMVIGFADQASAVDPVPCSPFFPSAKKESYYPCMWQVNKIVDLFGHSGDAYQACFPKKDPSGKIIDFGVYPAASGIDGGAYYFTKSKLVGPESDRRQKSSGQKIMMIESSKDGDGVEYLRVIDIESKPQRVVALTKKGCLLHSFNLIDSEQKGHAVSAETCKAIIDARKGKNGSEGEATQIARANTTTEKSMNSALKNCDDHTTIGVLARRNPSGIKSSGRTSGSSEGGSSKKAK
jgi:hypothetical protein